MEYDALNFYICYLARFSNNLININPIIGVKIWIIFEAFYLSCNLKFL